MSKPENSPAFPNTGNPNWGMEPDYGMTLRDWFAGQYVSGIHGGGATFRDAQNVAEEAYSVADAMLAERAKPCAQTPGEPA